MVAMVINLVVRSLVGSPLVKGLRRNRKKGRMVLLQPKF